MKKLLSVTAALGLLAGASARGQSSSTPSTLSPAPTASKKDEKAKGATVELKKKEKKPKLTFPINLWQSWGYQSENPIIATSVYLFPSFTSGKHRIGSFVGVTLEYTKPDDGRRLYWTNTFLSYAYSLWTPKFGKHEFGVKPGWALMLPTDVGSQARTTLRLATGPRLYLSWSYGILSLSYALSFRKFWNGSTTENITVDSNPVAPGGVNVQQPVVPTTGRPNVNYDFFHILGLDLKFTKKLYFAAQLWIINQVPYALGNGDEFTSPNAAPGANRDSYWMFGEIGYSFTKLFSLGFGFSLSANQLSPASQFPYIPINNYNNNFVTYLSATFSPQF